MTREEMTHAASLMRQEAELEATPWLHGVAGFIEAVAGRRGSGNDFRWPHPGDSEWAEQIARAYLARCAGG